MKKSVVTGGCGFIGVHTCLRLLREGWEVWALDNLSRAGTDIHLKELSQNPKFHFVKADVRDAQAVSRLIAEQKPTLIIHLAAQVAVTTSVADPRSDLETNILGTFNVLEAARAAGNQPFLIYSSTNKVYGKLEALEISEDKTRVQPKKTWKGVDESTPLDFHSPYGCSKGAADQYVRDYCRIYGIDTVVLRQSCIYGPKQMGIEDQGWVAWFAIAAMQGRPITLYGSGKQVRDLLYVDDLVDLYMSCFKNRAQVVGKAFNCGGGRGNSISLIDYLSFLEKSGYPSEIRHAEMRPGDQWIFVSNNGALKKATGWEPKTDWETGIREMLAFLEKSQSLRKKKAA